MTSLRRISCAERDCIHYYRAMGPSSKPIHVCRAFPLGIPEAITVGKVTHDQPYAGDGGIVFQAVTDADEVLRYGSTEPEMTRGNTPDQAVQMDASAWSDSFDPVAEQEAMEDGSDDEQDIEPAEAAPEMEAGGVEPESGDDDEEATKIGPSWDESKIRRIPKGMPGAGRFAPKYVGYVRGREMKVEELSVWLDLLRRVDAGEDSGILLRDEFNRDRVAEQILDRQGFNNLPLVLSPDEFEAWIEQTGATRLYRGVNDSFVVLDTIDSEGPRQFFNMDAAQVAEQLRSGPMYWGEGTYGGGIYTTPERYVAESYATSVGGEVKPGALIEMALLPNARVIEHKELERLYSESTREFSQARLDRAKQLKDSGDSSEWDTLLVEWEKFLNNESDPQRDARIRINRLYDMGRMAAMLGYDAISTKDKFYGTHNRSEEIYVILNRTALVVKAAGE